MIREVFENVGFRPFTQRWEFNLGLHTQGESSHQEINWKIWDSSTSCPKSFEVGHAKCNSSQGRGGGSSLMKQPAVWWLLHSPGSCRFEFPQSQKEVDPRSPATWMNIFRHHCILWNRASVRHNSRRDNSGWWISCWKVSSYYGWLKRDSTLFMSCPQNSQNAVFLNAFLKHLSLHLHKVSDILPRDLAQGYRCHSMISHRHTELELHLQI